MSDNTEKPKIQCFCKWEKDDTDYKGFFKTKFEGNQVIAFVVGTAICFLFTVSGMPIVLNFFSSWTPQALLDTIASFSFITNFTDMTRGVIDIRNIIYFISLIMGSLSLNIIIINQKKGL